MDWMFLAQVTEEWRPVLKSVMNFGSHKIRGEELLDFQEGLCLLHAHR